MADEIVTCHEHDAINHHNGEDSREGEGQKVTRCAIKPKVPSALCNSTVASCDSRYKKLGLMEEGTERRDILYHEVRVQRRGPRQH